MFAYTIHAELNKDGSYKVTMFDIEDEAPIYTVIQRAKITIERIEDDGCANNKPLLTVKSSFVENPMRSISAPVMPTIHSKRITE